MSVLTSIPTGFPPRFTGTAKVICFGDSITWGSYGSSDISSSTGGYPDQLVGMLTDNYTIVNAGVPGKTAFAALNDIGSIISQFDPSKDVNAVIVGFGVNDFVVLGRTAAQVQADLQNVCTQLKEAGFYVIVFNEPEPFRSEDGSLSTFEGFLTYAAWVRNNYKTFANSLVDITANPYIGHYSTANNYYWLHYNGTWDREHPGVAGYSLIANAVMDKLLTLK